RDHSEARFVALHNVGSPAEAEMINDILQQNDIRSAVQSGGADMFASLLSTAATGAVVLVDERDYDRAMDIYNSFFGKDTTPLTGTTAEEDEEIAREAEES
ncbi:MAG: putative prokaryotic signal transducing protein, partial [Acidobacteriota bacterium]|nr:putative prokaryotic signal transducing protein [Acidobacteriota bacterium]